MPDAKGRFRPISVPAVPWCAVCKLVKCECPRGARTVCCCNLKDTRLCMRCPLKGNA